VEEFVTQNVHPVLIGKVDQLNEPATLHIRVPLSYGQVSLYVFRGHFPGQCWQSGQVWRGERALHALLHAMLHV
jgi:hypothetical protein